ncbi:MAG: cytochrome c5 family protein [Gammaproteobacteria bacterium]|nr:cytochrome c5 family protein [Gammaproteobacteria bacterium]MDH5592231.1 cytochrome c5 family protein [Gammaproteobacteria bacterium]
MNTQKSSKFFVGSIITFLILFGLVKIILSTMQDIEKHAISPESMTAEAVEERIKPVAQEYVGEAPVVETAPVVEASASTGGNGEKIVTQACAMCHSTGMMSSPKLGSAADWAPRIEKGIDTLYSNAINGFNMMPAKGGNPALSDDDVKAAVDHMVSQAK